MFTIGYFAAMRFDCSPAGRAFWRDALLLFRDPANGREIVVRPVDWVTDARAPS